MNEKYRRSPNHRSARGAGKAGTRKAAKLDRRDRARFHSGEHLRAAKVRDIQRAVERALQRGKRDKQGEAWQRGLDQGGKTPGQPNQQSVTVHGADHIRGGSFTLTFTAYALDVQIVDNCGVVSTFSNGVVLTQRMEP